MSLNGLLAVVPCALTARLLQRVTSHMSSLCLDERCLATAWPVLALLPNCTRRMFCRTAGNAQTWAGTSCRGASRSYCLGYRHLACSFFVAWAFAPCVAARVCHYVGC